MLPAPPMSSTEDPYLMLKAWVMLHRIRVCQALPAYGRFVERCPSILPQAQASGQDVHQALFSLGLCWRIGPVREMTPVLVNCFDGEVPKGRIVLRLWPDSATTWPARNAASPGTFRFAGVPTRCG